MRKIWTVLAAVLMVIGGGAFASIASASKKPPPIHATLTGVSWRVSAPSLPIEVFGKNLTDVERVLFVQLNGKRGFALVHKGYAVDKHGHYVEVWTPKLPPGAYRLEVQTARGLTNSALVHVFPTERFRAPWVCSKLWHNYTIEGFRHVWITCKQEGHFWRWWAPKRKPTPIVKTTTPSGPAAPPSQPATAPSPPPIIVVVSPPAPAPAPSTPVVVNPPAPTQPVVINNPPPPPPSSTTTTTQPKAPPPPPPSSTTTTTNPPPPPPKCGGDVPGSSPCVVTTTMSVLDVDNSYGAIGGTSQTLSVTLHPSNPAVIYSAPNIGTITVTTNSAACNADPQIHPVTVYLGATTAGDYTAESFDFGFPHSPPCDSANQIVLSYSGGTETANGITYALSPDIYEFSPNGGIAPVTYNQ